MYIILWKVSNDIVDKVQFLHLNPWNYLLNFFPGPNIL